MRSIHCSFAAANVCRASIRWTAFKITWLAGLCSLGLALKAQPLQPEVLFDFPARGPAFPSGKVVRGNDGNLYGTTSQGGRSGDGAVFKVATNGTLTTVASFGGLDGSSPQAGLTLGANGSFYGTTSRGGGSGNGTVFEVTPDGTLTTLASFGGSDGSGPEAGLTLGPDGNFYGTTYYGGSSDSGTVFKMTPEGTLTALASFNNANGKYPRAELTLGSDGNFYGTTSRGGISDAGTVFKVTSDGTLTRLASFSIASGWDSYGGLTLGNDGNFYGTTREGGASGWGTVFKVTTNGKLTTLTSFNSADGAIPQAALTLGEDGNFYGTTFQGGAFNAGTVFKVTTNGALAMLASFNNGNGTFPESALTAGSDGIFYGTTYQGGSFGYGTVFQVTTNGALAMLASLGSADGAHPGTALTQGGDGNFYGTTGEGGIYDSGTVFQVTTNGELTSLVLFDGANGASPQGALTAGTDGNFYGTTASGGRDYGTIFKVAANGTLTTLVSFDNANGWLPEAALTTGADGNFYGTTFRGGSGDYGTIFKVTTNGTLTTLAAFNNANGKYPEAALTLGSDGNFYGTTREGGTSDYGTVFKVTTNGMLTMLVAFGNTNGANPLAGVTLGADGNFYGTTYTGGSSDGSSGSGTIFKMTTNGVLTTLISFGYYDSGANPLAGLTLGADGNFYGTTTHGGSSGYGTVFQMTTNGTLVTLVSFDRTNGASPQAALTLGSDGDYYGTTSEGGSGGAGTVFRLSPRAPQILSQPRDQVVVAGSTVTFEASVFGAPPLSYQWTLNNTNLPGETRLSLTLSNVGVSLSGNYALLVTNSLGNASSSNAVLSLAVVTTLPVSGISATGAVLNGSVAQVPYDTFAWFEWGTDTNYGQMDGFTQIPGGTGTVPLSEALSGLDGESVYHYRVGWNVYGYFDYVLYGTDQTFQVGLPPTAVTLAATGITANSVNLNARINPEGRQTTVWFNWGPTVDYDKLTPATSVGSGSDPLSFNSLIAGLSWNATYHYQVVASNSLGVVGGRDTTFLIGAPLAVTGPATAVTSSNAVLNGRVTPNSLPTTAWFEWGTNASYGRTALLGNIGSSSTVLSVSTLLAGFDPGVTCHFRLSVSNSAGIAFGADAQIRPFPNAYAQSVLADQPLVCYRFEEASGTLAFNSGFLGAPADGTYNSAVSLGNPSLVPAFGYAAGFNNTNSAVAVPALGVYDQITIEAWVKPRSFGLDGPGNPHRPVNSIYATDNWLVGALRTQFAGRSGVQQFEFSINGNDPQSVEVGSAGLFPGNSWVHLAATYDSAAGETITYVNGRPLTTNILNTAVPVNLTAAHIGAWTGDANWFDGGLDEFAIYGTVLSASRIQAHYQQAIGNVVLLSAQTGNQLTLSWIGPGFKLEHLSGFPSAAGWTNLIGGNNSPVSVTLSNSGNQFFRLSGP